MCRWNSYGCHVAFELKWMILWPIGCNGVRYLRSQKGHWYFTDSSDFFDINGAFYERSDAMGLSQVTYVFSKTNEKNV